MHGGEAERDEGVGNRRDSCQGQPRQGRAAGPPPQAAPPAPCMVQPAGPPRTAPGRAHEPAGGGGEKAKAAATPGSAGGAPLRRGGRRGWGTGVRGGWRRAPYLGGRHHRDLLEVVERHAGRLPEPHAAGKGKKSPCLSREPRASVSGRRGEREGGMGAGHDGRGSCACPAARPTTAVCPAVLLNSISNCLPCWESFCSLHVCVCVCVQIQLPPTGQWLRGATCGAPRTAARIQQGFVYQCVYACNWETWGSKGRILDGSCVWGSFCGGVHRARMWERVLSTSSGSRAMGLWGSHIKELETLEIRR